MLSRLHASNPMSVDKPLDSPEENVLKDFCRVNTNSENKTRSKLSSVAQPVDSTPTPENISAEELKGSLQLFLFTSVLQGAPEVDGRAIRQRRRDGDLFQRSY
ncbi:hypothetical protein GQ600_17695 [Phytophthora cactorum]|nr:hypothetical protein GQ600_17695 [Phytophthora cactorum]